jgi:hypothetical protein
VYEVVADINGVRWATARYAVVSRASLTVHVLPAAPGDTLHISGLHFLPHLKLALVVYPLFKGPSAAVIGRPVTDAYGRFVLVHIDPKLVPGQYLLRAWSLDALSSQLAETYFQVVV